MPETESHFTSKDRELIIRMSERLERVILDVAEINTKYERREEDFMTKEDGKKLVTQDQFWPIQKLVYGLTGLLLLSIVSAIILVAYKIHP